jgi:uncharacterized repeat protein (TIGR03803 family)
MAGPAASACSSEIPPPPGGSWYDLQDHTQRDVDDAVQLRSQSECPDGDRPLAALVQATNGDFYRTTWLGGAGDSGTVFKITPSGTLTTLYSFCPGGTLPCTDGFNPNGLLQRLSLAETYLAAGDPRKALQNAREALDRSEHPDCQYAWGKADGLHFCGMAHLRRGEHELARQRLTAALEIRERLGHRRIEETRKALRNFQRDGML